MEEKIFCLFEFVFLLDWEMRLDRRKDVVEILFLLPNKKATLRGAKARSKFVRKTKVILVWGLQVGDFGGDVGACRGLLLGGVKIGVV